VLLVPTVTKANTFQVLAAVLPLRIPVLAQTVPLVKLVKFCMLAQETRNLMTERVVDLVSCHQIATLHLVMVQVAPLAKLDTIYQLANALNA